MNIDESSGIKITYLMLNCEKCYINTNILNEINALRCSPKFAQWDYLALLSNERLQYYYVVK